jgi:hypothetical protein
MGSEQYHFLRSTRFTDGGFKRNAIQSAFSAVHSREDLLNQCDASITVRDSEDMHVDNLDRCVYAIHISLPGIDQPYSAGRPQASTTPFFQSLVQYYARRTNLMDTAAKMTFRLFCEQNLSTLLTGDIVDNGTNLEVVSPH